MRTVKILYIEKTVFDGSLEPYKGFIISLFHSLNYSADIVMYQEAPDLEKIDKIISDQGIDVILCDICFGTRSSEDALGLSIIKTLKLAYPEIVICGISGSTVSHRFTATSMNHPTFDFFINKMGYNDPACAEYAIEKMRKVFCSNIGIRVNYQNLPDRDKEFVSKPFFRRLLERITFTTHDENCGAVIEDITLSPSYGNHGSSNIFKMECKTRNGGNTTTSILKCSGREDALREIDNYNNYVNWYSPCKWRPEMTSFAVGGSHGLICYGFPSKGEVPYTALSERISLNDYGKVDLAVGTMLDSSHNQWYGLTKRPAWQQINHYYQSNYFQSDEERPFNQVAEIIEMLDGSVTDDGKYNIAEKVFPAANSLFDGLVFESFTQCLCFGGISTHTIQVNELGELICIDFSKVRNGHVFHDHVEFEICLRLCSSSRDSDFNTLLHNEIAISNRNYEFITGSSIWNRVEKIRDLAESSFPDEDPRSYYYGLAMCAFSSLRRFKDDPYCYESHELLAVLLANLKKLEELGCFVAETNAAWGAAGEAHGESQGETQNGAEASLFTKSIEGFILEELNGTEISDIKMLGGGLGGSQVFRANVNSRDSHNTGFHIIKLADKASGAKYADEETRKCQSIYDEYNSFKKHLVQSKCYSHEGVHIIISDQGNLSLLNSSELSRLSVSEKAKYAKVISYDLLDNWNNNASKYGKSTDFFSVLLGGRIESGGRFGIRTARLLSNPRAKTVSFDFSAKSYPNPYYYISNASETMEILSTRMRVAFISGKTHGDLHAQNIICDTRINKKEYALIDYSHYEAQSYILYDHAILEVDNHFRFLKDKEIDVWAHRIPPLLSAGFDEDYNDVDCAHELSAFRNALCSGIKKWQAERWSKASDKISMQYACARVAAGIKHFCSPFVKSYDQELKMFFYISVCLENLFRLADPDGVHNWRIGEATRVRDQDS